MYLLFCLLMLGLIQCVGLERIMTGLDSADKALKSEYKRVDAKLHPDRAPLVAEPHVVRPRQPPLRSLPWTRTPMPRKEGYVTR